MNNYYKALQKVNCANDSNKVYYCYGPTGPAGRGLTILGSYSSVDELIATHPLGKAGDSYIINNDLYVWVLESNSWENVGPFVGPEGPRGEQGPEGMMGPTGPQGIIGPQGEMGPEGKIGPTGPQGIAGPQGNPGIEGPMGPMGPEGKIGPMGPAGTPGTSVTILGSFPDFAALEAAVPIGSKGASYLVGPDLYVWSDEPKEWKNVGQIKGPQGEQGKEGMQGPPGMQGPIGPKGEQGPQGLQGPRGEQGPQGERGLQGEIGPMGERGPAGPQGVPGPQGERGPMGERGPQGIPGPLEIPSAFFMTANDDLDAYGIEINSNARIPIETKIYDMNENFILSEENTISIKSGGVYKIEFMVEAYTSKSALYPGQQEVISVGLRKVGEPTVYVGGSTWDYQEPVVRINAHGIVTTVLNNDEFELVNLSQDTIHLVSPNANRLITTSFFANPIVTLVIEKIK